LQDSSVKVCDPITCVITRMYIEDSRKGKPCAHEISLTRSRKKCTKKWFHA